MPAVQASFFGTLPTDPLLVIHSLFGAPIIAFRYLSDSLIYPTIQASISGTIAAFQASRCGNHPSNPCRCPAQFRHSKPLSAALHATDPLFASCVALALYSSLSGIIPALKPCFPDLLLKNFIYFFNPSLAFQQFFVQTAIE